MTKLILAVLLFSSTGLMAASNVQRVSNDT
ncbi:MAG: hypothetical protein ACJARO_001094, partial [Bacteriovoracaceae bacterium]